MLKFLIFKDFSNKLYENKALYALAQMAHMYLILTFHFFLISGKLKLFDQSAMYLGQGRIMSALTIIINVITQCINFTVRPH